MQPLLYPTLRYFRNMPTGLNDIWGNANVHFPQLGVSLWNFLWKDGVFPTSHPSTGRLLGGKFPGSAIFPAFSLSCSTFSHHFHQCPTIFPPFPMIFPQVFVSRKLTHRVQQGRTAPGTLDTTEDLYRHRCGSISLEKWWFETTISWEFIADIADLWRFMLANLDHTILILRGFVVDISN